MKVGLITTLSTNVGDDFIREGIIHSLKNAFPNEIFEFVLVNKHEPATLYPPWHPIGWGRIFPTHFIRSAATEILSRIFYKFGGSLFEDCDLIIQCGAPVFFYKCWFTEWSNPIWRHVAGRLSKTTTVLNLAAGSCYPWEQLPEQVSNVREQKFIRDILSYCKITTVRDRLAEQVVTPLAGNAQYKRIPCSAFLAPLAYLPPSNDLGDDDKYIMINYMSGAGHYDYGLNIDHRKWESTVSDLVRKLKQHHKVAFICHNEAEEELAAALNLDVKIFLPDSISEYFRVASMAKAGVFNRMHACVGFAGLGIPSVGIGIDSRMLMVQEVGLNTRYVKDATATELSDQVDKILEIRGSEKNRLRELQAATQEMYVKVLRETFPLMF
jgi:hypothetical protein